MGRKGIVDLKRLKFRLNEPSSYEQKFFEAMEKIPRHPLNAIPSFRNTYLRRILEIIREMKELILFNRIQIKVEFRV